MLQRNLHGRPHITLQGERRPNHHVWNGDTSRPCFCFECARLHLECLGQGIRPRWMKVRYLGMDEQH